MGNHFPSLALLELMYEPLVQEFILKYIFPCNMYTEWFHGGLRNFKTKMWFRITVPHILERTT